MKEIIIYHKADWDGLFSAAIASKARRMAKLYGMNYGDECPELDEYDKIYIVDFSLDVDTMIKYKDRIVWIDHHAPKIKEVAERMESKDGLPPIKGKYDITGKYSAAYLCWQHMTPYKNHVPQEVRFVSAYDVHNKEIENWSDTLAFQMYLRTQQFSMYTAQLLLFGCPEKYYDDIDSTLENQVKIGSMLLDAKREEENKAFKLNAWDVTIDGYKGKALLTHDQSSMICEQTLEKGDVDFCLLLNRHPRIADSFSCSIRVGAGSDFNACEFAMKHNGGGHVKAAGCVLSLDEFTKLFITGSL